MIFYRKEPHIYGNRLMFIFSMQACISFMFQQRYLTSYIAMFHIAMFQYQDQFMMQYTAIVYTVLYSN